jgi:hypothetical protein
LFYVVEAEPEGLQRRETGSGAPGLLEPPPVAAGIIRDYLLAAAFIARRLELFLDRPVKAVGQTATGDVPFRPLRC